MFAVITADPPWGFNDRLDSTGKTRGAANHYSTLTVAELCAFPLPPLAKDAHLFLWRVSSMQQEALDVVRAWGFVVKSEIVWLKRTKYGKRHFGMGRHVRLEHEVALICTRGDGAGIKHRGVRSTFTTELYLDDDGGGSFEAAIGRHSEKPEEFFRIVEDLTPGPYVELFARKRRPGWTCLGNEIPPPPIATPDDLVDFG